MIAVVWRFEVRPGASEEFEQMYGSDGAWTDLSRRSRSFLGSSFLRDLGSDTRYLLVEYWGEMMVYEKHLASFQKQLDALRSDWFGREIVLHMARTLRRLDLTARSLFATVEPGSCFAGSLLEIALAADRTYALDDAKRPVQLATSPFNAGLLPMTHGLSRLQARWLAHPERVDEVLQGGP